MLPRRLLLLLVAMTALESRCVEVAHCPPVGDAACTLPDTSSTVALAVAEERLATVLDWLLEVHDFHCGAAGRALVRTCFSWFETLRVVGCALRFLACGPAMEQLYAAECERADFEAESVRGLDLGFKPVAHVSACSDFGTAVAAAVSTALEVGRGLRLEGQPCDQIAQTVSQPLLYPSDRSSGLCDLERLPLPGSLSVDATRPSLWRDITAHLPPGRPVSVDGILGTLMGPLLPRGSRDLGDLPWVVNLGAGDGACETGAHFDPANCLLFGSSSSGPFRGVLLEGQPDEFKVLAARSAERCSGTFCHRPINVYVTPETVVETIASALPTSEPALLKIDIDNGDCYMLRQLLAVLSPLVVHVEVNPLFPPPMVFRQAFDRNLGEDGRMGRLTSQASGCSVQAMLEDANFFRDGRPGVPGDLRYRLLHVEFANVVLVREDALPFLQREFGTASCSTIDANAEAKWRAGYLCHPLARHLHRREWDAKVDPRALAHPATPLQQRLEWAREWLGRVAPGAERAGSVELRLAQE